MFERQKTFGEELGKRSDNIKSNEYNTIIATTPATTQVHAACVGGVIDNARVATHFNYRLFWGRFPN